MMVFTMRLACLLLGVATQVFAVDPIVDVGVAKYKGRIVGDGTTQWLGMRYAQAPVGELRFKAPKKLGVNRKSDNETVIDASKVRNNHPHLFPV